MGVDMEKMWIHEKLKNSIGIKRYEHSVNVMNVSIDLANHYGYSTKKAAMAGLLHDCGKLQDKKNILKLTQDFGIILDNVTKNNKELVHALLGKELAKREYNVEDEEILDAIRFHTTGRENMNLIEKIVYIADVIEPNRDFPGIEKIRNMAYKDIDRSVLYSMNNTIKFLIDKGWLVHLDTIKGRNQLLNLKNLE